MHISILPSSGYVLKGVYRLECLCFSEAWERTFQKSPAESDHPSLHAREKWVGRFDQNR